MPLGGAVHRINNGSSQCRRMRPSTAWLLYTLSAAGLIATEFLKTFLDFPPRQEPGSFGVDGILKQLESVRSSRMGG